MPSKSSRVPVSLLVAAFVAAAGGVVVSPSPGDAASSGGMEELFRRVATYPVYENRPAGEDLAKETAAEISAVSDDGKTLIYTDSPGERVGFLDLSDPAAPRGLGTTSLWTPADGVDEPTSVAVAGSYALVVVNTRVNFKTPSGRLDVLEIATRRIARSFQLAGQPDSIAISQDRRLAAIAIENERDVDAAPPERTTGDLPQAPPGSVALVDLNSPDPASWAIRQVALTAPDGTALPVIAHAGIVESTDPEPEYVSINRRGQVAVTLQENNGIVLIDAASGAITDAFSAGTTTLSGVDTVLDGKIDLTGQLTNVAREPDAVTWIDDRYLATANEGDWRGGTRGWSIFDTKTRTVVWDAGDSIESMIVRNGLYSEDRAELMGSEPEGLTVAEYNGTRYGFVCAERGGFVAVYDLNQPTAPRLRQVLATTAAPEGLLAIPSRGLLVVSNEGDVASSGVRSTVQAFSFGPGTGSRDERRQPWFPSIRSADGSEGRPIGWGSLSGLSSVPGSPGRLYTVTDGSYVPTRILTIDTGKTPAVITKELVVRDAAGVPIGYDAEGVHARPGGGFWLAAEGATPADNALVRLRADGTTALVVPLPDVIKGGLGSGPGLQGVTGVTTKAGEQVWVVLGSAVVGDSEGVLRLGRYDVASGLWNWFGYQLEDPARTTLSEITALGGNRLAVIERDRDNGPAATIKRVYSVEVPRFTAPAGNLPMVRKRLARDLLPDLRATAGWTPELVEGLAVGADGICYAVTDNDAVRNANGETMFLRLGRASQLFG